MDEIGDYLEIGENIPKRFQLPTMAKFCLLKIHLIIYIIDILRSEEPGQEGVIHYRVKRLFNRAAVE